MKSAVAPIQSSERSELVGIQYIRAAAALMVAFSHANFMMAEPKYFSRQPFSGFFSPGGIGVDQFFCLSGFIIVYITMTSDLKPKMLPKAFFIRRFTRIVPFMWLVIASYAALRLAGRGSFPYMDYLRGFTLWPIGKVEPNQVWTLRNEWLFYIVFAATFLLKNPLIFIVYAVAPVVVLLVIPHRLPLNNDYEILTNFLVNNVNLLFGFGVLTGIVYLKFMPAVKTKPWAAAALALTLCTVFIVARLISYNRGNLNEVAGIGVLCCICLLLGCLVTPSRGYIAQTWLLLGNASYSIYLSHTAFISAAFGLFSSHDKHASDLLIISVTMTITIGTGVLIHIFVEKPVVGWSKKLLTKAIPQRLSALLGERSKIEQMKL